MKRKIFAALFAILTLTAFTAVGKDKIVVWEHPATESNRYIEGFFSILMEINRVEFTESETRVMMHISYREENWLRFASGTYLKAGNRLYALKSCDGIELDKEVHLTDHNRADVVFHFEPLPLKTERFDFIEGDFDGAFRLLGIEQASTRANRLFPSNWRNNQTGDWVIGFYDDFAIYNCQFWNYKQRQQSADNYTFVLENNGKEVTVNVDKNNAGQRAIAIDGAKANYSFISSITLPDYPVKDTCKTFRDTHYQTDTVTLIGWLKDMPQHLKNLGNEYEVGITNIFTDKQIDYVAKIDSLGRFVAKIPLLNSSEMFFDWDRTYIRTLFEPGETYFLLYDYKEGHKMFMGKNCRLQNETLAHPIQWLSGNGPTAADSASIMKYLEEMKNLKADRMNELAKTVKAHPTISDRYITYLTGNYNINQGKSLAQGTYSILSAPKEYYDYIYQQHWQNRPSPYTLYREFTSFRRYFVEQLVRNRYSFKVEGFTITTHSDMEVSILRRYREAGKVSITDEELAIIEHNWKLIKSLLKKEIDSIPTDNAKQTGAILQREDIKNVRVAEAPLYGLYQTLAIADSLGCDSVLRDIIITHYFHNEIEHDVQPLAERSMLYFEENVTMPAAKEFLRAEQDKYLSILNKDISKSQSIKSADNLKDISDGEALLSKIIEPYKGRFILLDVWGTWCAPCRQLLSQSKSEFELLKDFDLVYLYLANNSPDASWKNVIKEYELEGENIVHYNLPTAQQSAIEHYLKVSSFPTYKLIDRDGHVLDINISMWNPDALVKLLKSLNE